MSKFSEFIGQMKLAFRTYDYRKSGGGSAPEGKTYLMLKWFRPEGYGAYRRGYKYTMPNSIYPVGEWHVEPVAKLCEFGFHCSDLEYISKYQNGYNNQLYVVECGGQYEGELGKVAFTHMRVIAPYDKRSKIKELLATCEMFLSEEGLRHVVSQFLNGGHEIRAKEHFWKIKEIERHLGLDIVTDIINSYRLLNLNPSLLCFLISKGVLRNRPVKLKLASIRGTWLHRMFLTVQGNNFNDIKVKKWSMDNIEREGEVVENTHRPNPTHTPRPYVKTLKKYSKRKKK